MALLLKTEARKDLSLFLILYPRASHFIQVFPRLSFLCCCISRAIFLISQIKLQFGPGGKMAPTFLRGALSKIPEQGNLWVSLNIQMVMEIIQCLEQKPSGMSGFKHMSSQSFVNSDWNFSQPQKSLLHAQRNTHGALFFVGFFWVKNNELAPPSPAIPDFRHHPQREPDGIFRANPAGRGELVSGRGFGDFKFQIPKELWDFFKSKDFCCCSGLCFCLGVMNGASSRA